MLSTLESLGWMVSWEKSSLDPSQSKVYLGYWVESVAQRVFPSPGENLKGTGGCVGSPLDRRGLFKDHYESTGAYVILHPIGPLGPAPLSGAPGIPSLLPGHEYLSLER